MEGIALLTITLHVTDVLDEAQHLNLAILYGSGASIDQRKLYGYLLSTKHPVGQAKARVFAGCGYHAEDADRLAEELKRLLVEGHLVAVVESSCKTIRCAHGGLLTLRTVWIRETDDAAPRFVTAYPA